MVQRTRSLTDRVQPSACLAPHKANLCHQWLGSCWWLWGGHKMRTLGILMGSWVSNMYIYKLKLYLLNIYK